MVLKPAEFRVMLASLLGVATVTFVCFKLIHSSPTTAALLLLLVVLLTSISAGLTVSFVTALAATACLDYFFLPPIGLITIAEPQNWVALFVFGTISLVAGQLSSQLKLRRDELVARQQESEKLHALSRTLLLSGTGEEMRRIIVNQCMQLFELTDLALFESYRGTFIRSSSDKAFPEAGMRCAREPVTTDFGGQTWNVLPISFGNLLFGSMAYVRPVPLPAATVQSWASTIALGLAQIQAQEAASRDAAVRRSEELKSVMIDALAHDLKTPLTAIEAAADMLANPLSLEHSADMVSVIQEETRGLRQLVDEAIHLARIDAKKLKLQMKHLQVLDLVNGAIQSLGGRASESRVAVDVPAELAPVLADDELVVQAIKQLLDNALKYSPAGLPVLVSAAEADGIISIAVRDSGPGLTELEQSRVFDKFYRGRYDRSAIQGTGMGLAIAREIAQAHGGTVGVRSYIGQGTEFVLSLRAAVTPMQMEAPRI